MKKYKIGDVERADRIGFKGRQYLTWLACKKCKRERWVRKGYEKDYVCVSCISRKRAAGINLNSFPHLDTCKCHRCRIGKGYFMGENNPMWKGGIKKMKTGYVYEYVKPGSIYSIMAANGVGNNYIAQHRLVMAKKLKRPLTKDETVHHKNGIKDDNRIENLELWASKHHSGQRVDDQIKWAIEILTKHKYTIKKPKS
jgi:hypothetical protein